MLLPPSSLLVLAALASSVESQVKLGRPCRLRKWLADSSIDLPPEVGAPSLELDAAGAGVAEG